MRSVEIKSWHSPDVEFDVWEPESLDEVCFVVELEIGEVGEERCDLFQIVVATPQGLPKLARPDSDVLSERGTLILNNFSWPLVRRTLEDIVERCATGDWNQTVERLQRYFRWEYEDHRS